MKEELDKALCEKYPKIFADRYKPMTETCMSWGFDIGDGWYQIIDILCRQIQHHVDWKQAQKDKYKRGDGCPQVVAVQVKEKFGTLRFYCTGCSDKIHKLINKAEEESGFICEDCGERGEVRGRFWLMCRCNRC